QLWADPRKLERWWGPPTYPATFKDHDLSPGGSVTYFMTSPEGERYHGWWRISNVEPPTSLEFVDGFADQDGNPSTEMPTTTSRVQLAEHEGGTRMTLHSAFVSREQMDQLVEMGVVEGLSSAVGQMDALLTS
ncbi:MAG: polyketide cyclase, partial [Nocardioidaceae bacterium]|nr:polyketide cyclase [Nocardioidaceae bacterium]